MLTMCLEMIMNKLEQDTKKNDTYILPRVRLYCLRHTKKLRMETTTASHMPSMLSRSMTRSP